MPQSQAWKNLERSVAKAFGGKRHLRGDNFSDSAPDVDLPDKSPFSIECKYRKNLPKLVTDALAQARRYDSEKVPLAVLKERGKHGFIVCMDGDEFLEMFDILNKNRE